MASKGTNNPAGAPRKYSRAKMAALLWKHKGNMSKTAEELGCSYGIVFHACKHEPSIKSLFEEIKMQRIQAAEEALDDLVEQRHPQSVQFLLERLGKDHGWSTKTELEIDQEVIIKFDFIDELKSIVADDEQKQEEEDVEGQD